MAKSTKRTPSGLLSESGKKAARGVKDAAKKVVGKKLSARSKSPSGNLSEAAKKAGRAVADVTRKAVGMKSTRLRKSGTK